VVCSGLYDDETETVADYASMIADLKARNIPMICANPDRTVERGGRIVYCAGAIAAAYEALDGEVRYAGKPYPPIYEMAMALGAKLRGAPVPKERALAIGDGVATDIEGAGRFGIRSVFVASGVYVANGESIADAATRLFASDNAARPIAVMRDLVW
jgi:HAD superfamily hydrolase (TIGR01459 family)